MIFPPQHFPKLDVWSHIQVDADEGRADDTNNYYAFKRYTGETYASFRYMGDIYPDVLCQCMYFHYTLYTCKELLPEAFRVYPFTCWFPPHTYENSIALRQSYKTAKRTLKFFMRVRATMAYKEIFQHHISKAFGVSPHIEDYVVNMLCKELLYPVRFRLYY